MIKELKAKMSWVICMISMVALAATLIPRGTDAAYAKFGLCTLKKSYKSYPTHTAILRIAGVPQYFSAGLPYPGVPPGIGLTVYTAYVEQYLDFGSDPNQLYNGQQIYLTMLGDKNQYLPENHSPLQDGDFVFSVLNSTNFTTLGLGRGIALVTNSPPYISIEPSSNQDTMFQYGQQIPTELYCPTVLPTEPQGIFQKSEAATLQEVGHEHLELSEQFEFGE